MDPFGSFVVFSIKHGMGNVNDLHELQTRSVFRGHAVPLAPTADAWRLFAPTAFPKKTNREEFVFRSIWEGPTEASKNFHTGKNYSPTTCEK